MGRKSSIKTLPPQVQAAVVQALEASATIDQIVAKLAELGHARSRSAVGRYAKDYAEVARHQRDIRVVAEAFASEFGSADNAEGKFMVQMLTSIGARMVLPMATDQDHEVSSLDFQRLAKATKDLLSSAKIDAERDAKIKEEAAKEARRQAAEAAEDEARSAGASETTIMRVKSRILGLAT